MKKEMNNKEYLEAVARGNKQLAWNNELLKIMWLTIIVICIGTMAGILSFI